jgi:hypothetical protein
MIAMKHALQTAEAAAEASIQVLGIRVAGSRTISPTIRAKGRRPKTTVQAKSHRPGVPTCARECLHWWRIVVTCRVPIAGS